ncbi:PREDICTED: probable cation-transporting ATPase 13A2, partial [Corvus brachyrhynchos]|uniref:probable cation-transporting ATPase 13A2 n=1 Tax=Corvus brachyrhynchos TaxID=85066 RepID=UPI000816684F
FPFLQEVTGYQTRTWRVLLCHAGSVLSAGLLLLLFHWKPSLEVQAKCKPCTLGQADWLLIRDRFGQCFTAKRRRAPAGAVWHSRTLPALRTVPPFVPSLGTLRPRRGQGTRRSPCPRGVGFVPRAWTRRSCAVPAGFDAVSRFSFAPALRSVLDEGRSCAELHLCRAGLELQEHSTRRRIYGPNLIEVPVKSYARLLVEEVLNPFYIFQVLSMVLWVCDAYYYYAACIFLISTFSLGLSLYETRKQSTTLRNMARMSVGVRVRRPSGGEREAFGDGCGANASFGIPVLHQNNAGIGGNDVMRYQDVGIRGNNVGIHGNDAVRLRNGVGVPLASAGMELQTRPFPKPIWICFNRKFEGKKRRFCTAKGDLISSILYPKPVSFKFYKDAVKFVMFLAVLALIGTVYSILILVRNQVPVGQIIIRALDLVTVIVPPALPAAMTVGTIYAQNRLKKQGIFCISPPPPLRGQLVGDPVALKMLESTGWRLEMTEEEEGELPASQQFGMKVLAVVRPPPEGEQPRARKHQAPVGILRRFPFSSSFQRMSVLVKLPGEASAHAYVKGAPEMVASLCRKETVPPDFSRMLRHYTTDGFRVLALACKALGTVATFEEALQLPRDSVESGLSFLGFLVMKNVLKPESAPVIHLLRSANIRPVMVTGDNMLTAMNVARGCRMVEPREGVIFVTASPPGHGKPAALKFVLAEHSQGEEQPEGLQQQQQRDGSSLPPRHCHFALNGKSFQVVCEHFADLLPRILLRATVLARMLPEQKAQLVSRLQELDYCVGMCGDGANDCGALRAADVGISLSEAEASVASPFTSRVATIECVPRVIREGRCSLVTSFGVFKYMALYSLVQFVSVLLLYTINTNLSDFQFLFFDLVITTTVAVLMGRTGPAPALGVRRPQGALISGLVLGSLVLQTALLVAVQVLCYFITVSQSWFVPLNSTVTAPQNLPNYENTVLFCVSGLRLLLLLLLTRPLSRPQLFLLVLVLLFGLMIWLTLYPLGFPKSLLKLQAIEDFNFKLLLLGIAALNFFAAFVLETALDHGLLGCFRRLRRKKASKKLFKRLENE